MRKMFTISLCSLIIACGDKMEDTSEDVDTAVEVSEPADEAVPPMPSHISEAEVLQAAAALQADH